MNERREDIPLLANHFLTEAAKELNVDVKQLDAESTRFLSNLSWPGNVRQLQNTCRWLTVMSPGQTIHLEDMPQELHSKQTTDNVQDDWESALRRWADQKLTSGETTLLDSSVPKFEKIMIEVALLHTGGRRQDAAKLLGWGRNTLARKIRELEMEE
jgi:two-component system nitrogen regulation response regulator GlnG